METKVCSKCKEEKRLNEFNKNKQNKDGVRGSCRQCDKNIHKHYYLNNKHRLNKKRNKDLHQQWCEKNKEKRKEYQKKYKSTQEYKQKQKLWSLNYYHNNKEKIAEKKRNNKEYINATRRKYIKTEKYKILYNRNRTKKLKTNPRFKLDHYFSRYIRGALKKVNSSKANRNWETLVGYNTAQLKEHLEKQFKPEMNWDNHGIYWHIDHIKPKSWFNYDSAEHPEFKQCWSLENLQPLEAEKNLAKSNKYEG
jgi:hypothetical protein